MRLMIVWGLSYDAEANEGAGGYTPGGSETIEVAADASEDDRAAAVDEALARYGLTRDEAEGLQVVLI